MFFLYYIYIIYIYDIPSIHDWLLSTPGSRTEYGENYTQLPDAEANVKDEALASSVPRYPGTSDGAIVD